MIGYIGAGEFSRRLDYALNYTYALIKAGKVAAVKRGGEWQIRESEIQKRLEKRKGCPGAASAK